MRGLVHGDDFTFVGHLEDLKAVETDVRSECEVSVRGILGDDNNDIDDIAMLNRTIGWREASSSTRRTSNMFCN